MSEELSDIQPMRHSDIIVAFGDQGTKCAVAVNAELPEPVSQDTVYKWRDNDRIPPKYWPAILHAAKKAALSTITLEALANGAIASRETSRDAPAPEAA